MKIFLINIFWFISTIKNVIIFKYASVRLSYYQRSIFELIIKNNKNSLFAKENKFLQINSIEDWQKKVPTRSYEDYAEYVEKIKAGHKNILSEERVFLLEPTSGSSGANKLIPYTKGLQKQFQKAIDPWIFDLIIKKPRILMGRHYWSISPNNRVDVDSKVPIGFASDEEYLSSVNNKLLKIIKPVPDEVKKIENIESFWYVSLFFLIKEKNLSLISIWHPSWLEILLSKLDIYKDSLLMDIYNGKLNPPHKLEDGLNKKIHSYIKPNKKRHKELEAIFRENKNYKKIWPNLQIISLWQDRQSLKILKDYFPDVLFQYKGLIATEGMISFPSADKKTYNLAISSHFFEFRPIIFRNSFCDFAREKNILLAHQLKINNYYEVIITTAGGLYRYELGDIIKVVGFNKKCPNIEFVGRSNKVSDICGEKLNEIFVRSILKNVFTKYKLYPSFSMLAPVKIENEIFYTLFFEGDYDKESIVAIHNEIDNNLSKNYHYENCRKLKQLRRPRIFVINKNAYKVYVERLNSWGMNIGDIKPTSLSSYIQWKEFFEGKFL